MREAVALSETLLATGHPLRAVALGNLASAWLIVALTTRLIHNPTVRSMVRYGAWTWITLSILGLTEEFQTLLDSLAISFGEVRISVWLILQAVLVIGLLFYAARFVSHTSSARIKSNADISPSM